MRASSVRWLVVLGFLILGGCQMAQSPALDAIPETGAPNTEQSTVNSQQLTKEATATAANADVIFVRAVQTGPTTWTFHVTVGHPDTGWEDYADGWDVALPDGRAVKPDPDSPFTRLLTHPHETEQPFTRSQGGIEIPAGVTAVTVRAHDLVAGFGGREVVVDLTAVSGPDFMVEHASDS